MECFHVSPECIVYACGSPEDVIPDDVVISVLRHGQPAGSIICRYHDERNELTYTPTAGLPGYVVGLYIGDDYPESATGEGWTFVD